MESYKCCHLDRLEKVPSSCSSVGWLWLDPVPLPLNPPDHLHSSRRSQFQSLSVAALHHPQSLLHLLLANFQEVKLELDGSIVLRKSIHQRASSSTIPLEVDEPRNRSPSPVPRKSMKRPDALKFATHLQTYIAGASLPSNLSYLALVEPAVLHALQSWISETEDSRTLIGCVYSLISQLLQFSIEETDLDLSPERLAKLDGSMESWDTSLDLLEGLLECTPLLPYCVIYGLNDLDWAAGAEACAEVFDVLLRHRERADSVFNILLTIAGRSKTLARCISAEQRLYASDEIRRVERRGKRLDLVAPEALASPHVSPRISPERWL